MYICITKTNTSNNSGKFSNHPGKLEEKHRLGRDERKVTINSASERHVAEVERFSEHVK